MSTNPVLVPISLVSQFLANEKMASRHWFQCQMECLLDQVFDQLSTKFEDYLASNAITGNAHHTTIDTDHIQHQLRHKPSFQAHSLPQFQATTDQLIKTEFSVDVEQSPNQVQMINIDEQLNSNGIHSEALMFDQAQYPHSSSAPVSNLEQSTNQNGDEYGLNEDDYQTRNEDIDDDASRSDIDEINVKKEIDDSHVELITIDQAQCGHSSSVPTSNIEQLNQNDDKDGTNGQLPNEDDYASRFDIGEVKVKEDIDDSNNELIISGQNSRIDLPVSASVLNEQSNHNWTIQNDEEYDLDGTRDDEPLNGLDYGDIDDDARMDCDEVEVKDEIGDTNNQLYIVEQPQNPHLLSVPTPNIEQSNQNEFVEKYGLDGADYQPLHRHLDDAMHNELITDEQNLPILPSVVTVTSNELANQNDDEDDDGLEEENDQPPNEDLRDGHDDNERNDHTEESFLQRKKPRIDKTQPNIRPSRVTRQSSRLANQTDQEQHIINDFDERHSNEQTEPTDEAEETNELNNQDKQIHIISLKCLDTDCQLTFKNKTELNLHMNTQHGIHLHRCLVKDCKQSFSTHYKLGYHVKHFHSKTTQWHCDKCPKHFTTYPMLTTHNYHFHQLGQYRCAFLNCAFVGDHRQKVLNHCKNQHKPAVEFTCQHPGCGHIFNQIGNFKTHQRTHLGIKPYRCKWSDCNFACTAQSNALRHIKLKHLTPDQSSNEDDPKKYLEVLRDLF